MTYTGISCFAALNDKFPIKKVLNSYPKDIKTPGTAILDGLFGDNWKFPKMYCDLFSDRPHCIEYHLCFRNPLPIRQLRNRAKIITNKMEAIGNDNTKVIICPVLEDACKDDQFKNIVDKIKTVTPFEIVRNPCMGGNIVRPYDYEERHGDRPRFTKKPGKTIYNPDGISVDFNDGDKYFNRFSIQSFEKLISDEMFMWLLWYAPLQGFKDCKDFSDKPPIDKRKYLLSDKASVGMRDLLKKHN